MKIIYTLLVCLSVSAGYAQTKKAVTRPTATTAAEAVKLPGQAIYQQYCLACHQADGSGVPNLNPPLRGTDWVLGDKNRLINVLLKGLQGEEVEGEVYDNAMPAHDFLDNTQIADVLTYIRSNFTNKADAVTPDQVKAARGK
ncbi:c-type cytochrome [Spirosoma utsteinense]|uniref:Mono/diheme cytochrome c family protein n=1 Tax=Spirosoma utsteinense TaxID=2585773 RepID=A0ABR6W6S0_9BACT|nr:c-type cytochrome [Spirosoma utsteinense]MBC3785336.1 mono/diheme cytochrome c family protein [Spirosoma utsteinense]MBC3791637.1 mono/diheme cytochrome c family protein [Spirosoma utsteinense]